MGGAQLLQGVAPRNHSSEAHPGITTGVSFCLLPLLMTFSITSGMGMELSTTDYQALMNAIGDIKESNAGIRENQANLQRIVESFQSDLKENDQRLRDMQTNCNREREWNDYSTTKTDIYTRLRALETEGTKLIDVIRQGNAELKEELTVTIGSLSTRVSSLETAVQARSIEVSTTEKILTRISDKGWAVILIILTVVCTLGAEYICSFFRGGA